MSLVGQINLFREEFVSPSLEKPGWVGQILVQSSFRTREKNLSLAVTTTCRFSHP